MPERPKPIGALPVVDVIKPFTVIIDDIDRQAVQCNPWECVAANALNRRKGIRNAQVGAQYVYFTNGNVPMRGELTNNSRKMIRAYDRDNHPMPAGIRLEILPPRIKMGTNRTIGKKAKGEGTKRPKRIVKNPATRNIFVKPPAHDNG